MLKILVALGAAVLLLAGVAFYLHAPSLHGFHSEGTEPQSITLDAQPGREEFRANPNVRAFYDLAVREFANGPDNVDPADFEQKSFVIFRALGESMGGPEAAAAMQEHLKGIPREIIQIVKDDPHTLDNFENFATALMGPP